MEKRYKQSHPCFILPRSKTKLKDRIKNKNIIVDFAMRYGNPSIKSQLNKLRDKGCENIIILPLLPIFSGYHGYSL